MYARCNPTLSPLDGLFNANLVTIPIINEIHSTIQHLNNIDIVKHAT